MADTGGVGGFRTSASNRGVDFEGTEGGGTYLKLPVTGDLEQGIREAQTGGES